MLRISALVAILVLGLAGPAEAKNPPAKENVPVAASGEGIAPNAPDWVRSHVADVTSKPAPRSLSRVRRVAWTGCRTVWAYRGYNSWLGFTLFRYYQQVSWCSNGYSIYSFGRDRWPETHLGWQFNGHIGSSITGGSYSRSAWTQGSFSYCLGTCYDHKYPWVTINVNASGDWNVSTGG